MSRCNAPENFFFRGTGLLTAVRKNQPLVFLHNHHVYLKKLFAHGHFSGACLRNPQCEHITNSEHLCAAMTVFWLLYCCRLGLSRKSLEVGWGF